MKRELVFIDKYSSMGIVGFYSRGYQVNLLNLLKVVNAANVSSHIPDVDRVNLTRVYDADYAAILI